MSSCHVTVPYSTLFSLLSTIGNPRKKKNANEGTSDVIKKQKAASRKVTTTKVTTKATDAKATAAEDGNDDDTIEVEDGKRSKGDSIPWEKNPAWIAKAIEFLVDNPSFRRKLYSDSTSDATAQGRVKVQGKTTKLQMYEMMMDYVAGVKSAEEMKEDAAKAASGSKDSDGLVAEDKETGGEDTDDEANNTGVLSPENVAMYLGNRERFAKSLQQQFSRMKKQYGTHVKTLYDTGGGVKSEEEQANLIEKIREQFVHWDDLHAFWRELPNYNPVGVSNAKSGGNHAKRAGTIFGMEPIYNSEDRKETSVWKELSVDTPSSPRSRSEASSEAGAIDADEDDREVVVEGKDTKPIKSKPEKQHKLKRRAAFDIESLDEIHQQELAESANRSRERLALELQREENKRRKLDNDKERMKMEREARQAQLQRDQMMMNMMQQMMGFNRRNGGVGAQMGPPQGPYGGGNMGQQPQNYDAGENTGQQQNPGYHTDGLLSPSSLSGFSYGDAGNSQFSGSSSPSQYRFD
ncbi:unnamed protein product [Mycena citricolor]|uniref:No apical meristem-associated C-terminal domain-containing protein n=1 Tax=Mycena citricolor TaxID=2018698 RepID=A0AAD2JXM7_9AGAR|nr:unnamed protein product [Mycena citricolor]